MSTPTAPTPVEEKWPAFESGDIVVIEGRTVSKNNGWWSAVLLVRTFGKTQCKLYLWQEREDKNTHAKTWKRKQSWTVNSYNWKETTKIIDEFLEKRKTMK